MANILERTLRELAKDIHWSRKAVVIKVYHGIMLVENSKYTLADTARDLGLSKAFISESIKLAESLMEHPEYIHLSRNKALVKVRQ